MLIFVDSKMPIQAIHSLRKYGEVVEFGTRSLTYEAISGHPDIFFCPTPDLLVVAPNTPAEFLRIIEAYHINYQVGFGNIEDKYPFTARYNAAVSGNYLIHNLKITDVVIRQQFHTNKTIHVNQGYTRCNLLSLNENNLITSDKGIAEKLVKSGFATVYVDPAPVLLKGFAHGFFGGACGVADGNLFVCGSLNRLSNYAEIKAFIENTKLKIIELYTGPLVDVGTILCLPT
jgi:hypothetical protein